MRTADLAGWLAGRIAYNVHDLTDVDGQDYLDVSCVSVSVS
jgi:hypothetical protein